MRKHGDLIPNTGGRAAVERPDREVIRAVRRRRFGAGETLRSWAERNGENPWQVYKVLSGKRACVTGEAHRIAVKLGIKDRAPSQDARRAA